MFRGWLASYRLEALLALFVLATHAYFYNGAGWNQNARLGTIFAFVEPGPDQHSFRIDAFLDDRARGISTGDWARIRDHYYANKPPGSALLGIPVYWALHRIETWIGFDPRSARATQANAYLLTLAIAVFWSAVAAAAMLRFLTEQMGGGRSDALAIVLIYAFATLAFPFDTSLWGHTTAAAFAALGAIALGRAEGRAGERGGIALGRARGETDAHARAGTTDQASERTRNPRRASRAGRDALVAGFWLGLALLTEYLAGVSLVLGLGFLIARRATRSLAPAFLLGAAPPVLALLIYQKALFGGFLVTATAAQNPGFLKYDGGSGSLYGLPSIETCWALLASPRRGILVFMPILAFAAAGLWRALRGAGTSGARAAGGEKAALVGHQHDADASASDARRAFAIFCAANAAAAILAVSCFRAGWHGGDSTGARYLIASLPFWCFLLPRVSHLGTAPRAAFAALAAISCANMLVITATNPMMPSDVANPLYGELYPALLRGLPAARPQVWNLGGLLFGYEGIASLVPFAVLAAAGGFLLVRAARPAPPAPRP